jgi:hypothetical protein
MTTRTATHDQYLDGLERLGSGGGPRLVQRASGIMWSFVNGHPVISEGRVPEAPPGRGPGRLLRVA